MINAQEGFSATNAIAMKAKLAYIKLNSPTACPPRTAVPVNPWMLWEVLSLATPGSPSVMAASLSAMSYRE